MAAAQRRVPMMGRIGDYELEHDLGDHRFLARHVVLPRRAIVRIAPERDLELMREACILEAIAHPGVPRVYECGRIGGQPWLAVEQVEGEPLLRGDVLPAVLVAGLLRDVATVLANAHRRGIAHRNVRPETIIWCDGVRGFPICLIEWNQARTRDSRASQGLALPHRAAPPKGGAECPSTDGIEDDYVAPEGAVDARADIYALGAVAYEALTGTLPSQRLARRAPTIPGKLAELIEEMLSPAPEARPTAREVIVALMRVLNERRGTDARELEPGDSVVIVDVDLDIDLADDVAPAPVQPPARYRDKVRWTPSPVGAAPHTPQAVGTPIAILKPRS